MAERVSLVLHLYNGAHVVAGQPLNGHVLMTCPLPVRSAQVMLSLMGAERIHFETTHQESGANGTSRTVRHYHDGTTLLFHSTVCLPLPSSELQPGQYQLPFSLCLPPDLPPTMLYNTIQGRASLYYFAEAQLAAQGVMQSGASYRVPFTLSSLTAPPNPQVVVCAEQKVKKLLLFSQGELSARVTMPSCCMAGEGLGLVVEVDNGSKLDVSQIELKLKSTLQLTCSTGQNHFIWPDQGCQRDAWPGVPKHSAAQGASAQRLTYMLPCVLMPSVDTPMVKLSYFVEVKCKVDSKVARDVTLQAPLHVLARLAGPPQGFSQAVTGQPMPCVVETKAGALLTVLPTHSVVLPPSPPQRVTTRELLEDLGVHDPIVVAASEGPAPLGLEFLATRHRHKYQPNGGGVPVVGR